MLVTINYPSPILPQYFEFGEIGEAGFGYITLRIKKKSEENSTNENEIENIYHFPYKILKGSKGRTKIRVSGVLFHIFTQTGNLTPKDIEILNNFQDWFIKSFAKHSALWPEQKYIVENLYSKCLLKGEIYDLEFKIGTKFSYQIISSKTNHGDLEDTKQSGKIIIYDTKAQTLKKTKTDFILKMLRKEAQIHFEERTTLFAARMSLEFAKITIKTQYSKWGSCSIQKNINYNWRAIMLDLNLIDYLVVHELAHLKHMNHSQKFWDFVEIYMPGSRKLEKQLKNKSWLTTLYLE